jgi:hypothetical protein
VKLRGKKWSRIWNTARSYKVVSSCLLSLKIGGVDGTLSTFVMARL